MAVTLAGRLNGCLGMSNARTINQRTPPTLGCWAAHLIHVFKLYVALQHTHCLAPLVPQGDVQLLQQLPQRGRLALLVALCMLTLALRTFGVTRWQVSRVLHTRTLPIKAGDAETLCVYSWPGLAMSCGRVCLLHSRRQGSGTQSLAFPPLTLPPFDLYPP